MNLHDLISDNKAEIISMAIGALIATIIIIGFIGYKRIEWFVKEFIKMYSANEKSWLSKKRLESGIAFLVAEHGALFWLAKKYDSMTTTDFVMWAGIQLTVAGWMVGQIQKEKITNSNTDNSGNKNSVNGPE